MTNEKPVEHWHIKTEDSAGVRAYYCGDSWAEVLGTLDSGKDHFMVKSWDVWYDFKGELTFDQLRDWEAEIPAHMHIEASKIAGTTQVWLSLEFDASVARSTLAQQWMSLVASMSRAGIVLERTGCRVTLSYEAA